MINTLTFTSLYPSALQPRHGVFIEHRVQNLVGLDRLQTIVMAPVPWFPLKSQLFHQYSLYSNTPYHETRHNIEIYHPRYPVIPKIGMNFAPILLKSALIKPISKLIKEGYQFDLIDAYYFYPDGVAAILLGQYFNKPVIITALGSDINILTRHFFPRKMIVWTANRAAAITTVSQALKNKLLELGVAKNLIASILHGVDLNLFHPPKDRTELRQKLGLRKTTLISVGNLIELKGHDLAIQAMTALPDFELVIAGHGAEEQALKTLAAKLNVHDRVKFLGLVQQNQLCEYYGAADALILASSSEGIANVLMESMACGTPVITTNVGGSPEIVTIPEAGVIMPERSTHEIVTAAQRLLANYPDRSATRQYAEQFSWDRTTHQHMAIIDNILCEKKKYSFEYSKQN